MKGSCKTAVIWPDDGTQEITREMADTAEAIVGRPHVVLLHLHRFEWNLRMKTSVKFLENLSG